ARAGNAGCGHRAPAHRTWGQSGPQRKREHSEEDDHRRHRRRVADRRNAGVRAASADAYYKNCAAAWDAGVAPLHEGDDGYETPRLDRDGDGIACEIDPR